MMEQKRVIQEDPKLKRDDLIVITGGGGFIGGNLARYFIEKGFTHIRAVAKKPLYEWYLPVARAENVCLDLSDKENCRRASEGAAEVYNLAADRIISKTSRVTQVYRFFGLHANTSVPTEASQ